MVYSTTCRTALVSRQMSNSRGLSAQLFAEAEIRPVQAMKKRVHSPPSEACQSAFWAILRPQRHYLAE